jgi:UDP-3-O-[3-hydroxymyristoyl] glucosamine N-acyltransferase
VAEAPLTARRVADLVGGRLEGDGEVRLAGVAPLDRAGPDQLSFLISPRYLAAFRASRAGAALVWGPLAGEAGGPRTRIVVAEPAAALEAIARAFRPEPPPLAGVDATARLGPGVVLGPDVFVGPYAVIGAGARIGARTRLEAGAWIGDGVTIGEDCRIGPHAVCYPGASLGQRVVLKAGAVVGGPGFGFLRSPSGHEKLPHLGACILGDDVEVGSSSCVDRGNFDDTVIGPGTKIDNLVQIGHNVRIGARCLIMGTTGIAGSVRIGDDVVIAGGVGIADHARIGDRAVVGAKSVVFGPGEVPPDSVVSGYPARPHRAFLRAQAALYRLADLVEPLETLARDHARHGAPDHR